MCGRYTLSTPPDELAETFEVPPLTFEQGPRYNIAPGQPAPIVTEDRRGRRMGLMTWGLVPGWREEPGSGIVNARSESVDRKPAFGEAFRRRRCLIPADGFYEWRSEAGVRQPYWLHAPGGELLALAGIWERWARPGRETRNTFAILTTDANADVGPIHDRMPVLVPRADWSRWLSRAAGPEDVRDILRPAPDGVLTARRVSTRVNRAEDDDAGLIEAVDSPS